MPVETLDDFEFGANVPRPGRATVSYINEAGVPESVAEQVVRSRDVASIVERWSRSLAVEASGSKRGWDLFNRREYTTTDDFYKQVAMCQRAVEYDDVLSTLADVTENASFKGIGFECFDEDQRDAWEQIGDDLKLLTRLRQSYRELFKCSQVYIGLLWGQKVYTVRTKPDPNEIAPPYVLPTDMVPGAGAGDDPQVTPDQPGPTTTDPPKRRGNRKRKKTFAVRVPVDMTIFDPLKVLPVGQLMFGKERFAYIASRDEDEAFVKALSGEQPDQLVLALIEQRYRPSAAEVKLCQDSDIDHTKLWLFKRNAMFRHTLTRAEYERFASPRLKSVFEILDMKAHLRASDRATLIGNTNFIVVIKKGSDKLPAKRPELDNLGEQVRTLARMPVLVGDHRLSVDIVSPKTDHTLQAERWDVLDERLTFRALGTFSIQKGAGAKGSTTEVYKVVAQSMEAARGEMASTFQDKLIGAIVEANPGVLDEKAEMVYRPKRISIDYNSDIVDAILALRDRGDVSRETTLEELDFDQDVEALRRARERVRYDGQFQSVVPHSSPDANPYSPGGADPTDAGPTNNKNPRTQGARGGRPRGTSSTTKAGGKRTGKKAEAAAAESGDERDDEPGED